MKEYSTISTIPYSSERAVIVNVHTLLCTTLAILSTRRYMDMPLLVIDCPLNGESDAEALRCLQKNYDFDLICLPLRHHGDTLDDLFLHIQTDWLYVVDSDVEILNAEALRIMRTMRKQSLVDEKHIFGVGMKQVSGYGLPPMEHTYHAERMWIPYCCLNVALIRAEIKRGNSFNITAKTNLKLTGGAFRKVRNKLNKHKMYKLGYATDICMNMFRKRYKGHRIDETLYDTGALLFEVLSAKGLHYIDWSFYAYPAYVTHFCGVTRSAMYSNEPVAAQISDIEQTIRQRLSEVYHFDYNMYYE